MCPVSILVQSTTVDAMFSGDGPSHSTPSTYKQQRRQTVNKNINKNPIGSCLSLPCLPVWHKLGYDELYLPRLLDWLKSQQLAPPEEDRTLTHLVMANIAMHHG